MGKSSINGPFSMAMLNNQRVYQLRYVLLSYLSLLLCEVASWSTRLLRTSPFSDEKPATVVAPVAPVATVVVLPVQATKSNFRLDPTWLPRPHSNSCPRTRRRPPGGQGQSVLSRWRLGEGDTF